MGVAADLAVAGGCSGQHVAGIAGRLNPGVAALRVAKRRGGVCWNAKSEEDNAVGVGSERRVNENGAVETGGVRGVVGHGGVEALLHGGAGCIGVRVVNIVHRAARPGIVKSCARGGRSHYRLIHRHPVSGWQDVVGGQRVLESAADSLEGAHLKAVGGPHRDQHRVCWRDQRRAVVCAAARVPKINCRGPAHPVEALRRGAVLGCVLGIASESRWLRAGHPAAGGEHYRH